MAAVPILNQGSPVAALTVSSAAPSALPCDDTLNLLAALVAPHVQRLKYTNRHMEVERLVQRILTPLAAELSVQQGRFKRGKNACGEDVLCLDESRGLRGAQASTTSSVHVWPRPSRFELLACRVHSSRICFTHPNLTLCSRELLQYQFLPHQHLVLSTYVNGYVLRLSLIHI